MNNKQIRSLALGLVWRGDELLVFEGYDRVKEETYYRPLGGGIEFGERSHEALRREFREELGVELADVRYLAITENIFVCDGRRGHEIILLYEATLADHARYEQETFEMREETETLTARWMPLREFQEGGPPLYPDGLLRHLAGPTNGVTGALW
ncbi:MAG: NUDIX hydrolase [Chloroflexota bacterium]|nr:NUDIX hydrolase [Chloroflexota bacterium]